MATEQKSYYEVLNIDQDASQADIKCAFRELAKRYHPDTNRKDSKKKATKRLKEVMNAYRVLSNERERARYDVLLQATPDYEQTAVAIKERTEESQVKKMFGHLLDGERSEALEIYDQLFVEGVCDLDEHLDTRDYLDCLFLLAEHLEAAERNREATKFYEELYEREKEPPRHRYFVEEVEVRLKKLYSRKLPREAKSPQEEINFYERILQFDVDRSEKAFILKKIAEVHLKMGDEETATDVFQDALDLKPGLKGTATIRERLGFEPAP
ncbi:MAG: DnaJ domain-containing protein [Candidatus Brocadiia bacterium]